MMEETKRIVNDPKAIISAKSKWEYYVPCIMKQTKVKRAYKYRKSTGNSYY